MLPDAIRSALQDFGDCIAASASSESIAMGVNMLAGSHDRFAAAIESLADAFEGKP